MSKFVAATLLVVVAGCANLAAQSGQTVPPVSPTPPAPQTAPAPAYQPKFRGDPARSGAEFAALGYMRTLVNAQRIFKKRHNAYATSLKELIGQGSFTRRMANPDRGDYIVHFRSTGKEFSLALDPKLYDAAHRAFYIDQTGVFRVEDNKAATKDSPALK